MSESLVDPTNYTKLLTDLREMLASGQQSAQAALNEIRLSTYWLMGQRLAQDKQLADAATDSGNFIDRIATDLGLDPSLIYRIIQFYHLWPDAVPRHQDTPALSWTHIVELLSIKDDAERQFYFETASTQNWGRAALRKAIQKDLYKTIQLPATTSALKRDPSPLYVYKAIVQNVIDGDTLLVRIDLGFDVWVDKHIRFRGINTGELTERGVPIVGATDRAKQAKVYVQDKLKDIPFVVIKTYKTDMYGRFVADVFYHPTLTKREDVATKGIFLNDEILKAGLADLML